MIGETVNGVVAISPIAAVKLEAEIKGGFATINQKHNLTVADLVLDFGTTGITGLACVVFDDSGFDAGCDHVFSCWV